MDDPNQTTPTASHVVVEKVRLNLKPRRHRLEESPPPPMRVLTVEQTEEAHPAFKGRLRRWITRADAGDDDFRWLALATLRISGSLFIDDVKFRDGLYQRTATPPRPARNKKAAA
jgi:hypothetical protein